MRCARASEGWRHGVCVVSLVVGDRAERVRSRSSHDSRSQRLRHLGNSQDIGSRSSAKLQVSCYVSRIGLIHNVNVSVIGGLPNFRTCVRPIAKLILFVPIDVESYVCSSFQSIICS